MEIREGKVIYNLREAGPSAPVDGGQKVELAQASTPVGQINARGAFASTSLKEIYEDAKQSGASLREHFSSKK